MISHPSEYWEGCDPNADTTSKASYAGMSTRWAIQTHDELTALPVGTVVMDAFAATCTKDEAGWTRVTPAVANGAPHRRRPYLPADVLEDQS
jgi:hypothetical protein